MMNLQNQVPLHQSYTQPMQLNSNFLSTAPPPSSFEDERMIKTNILRKEFLEIDVSHLSYVTKEELYSYLDRKTNQVFDREIAGQLFTRIEKDYSQKVSVDGFIQVWLEAEEILKSKIQNTRKSLTEIYRTRKEYFTKLEELRTQEVLNSYGLMKDAYLNVSLISGLHLLNAPNSYINSINNTNNQNNSEPCVTMTFGEQTFQSGIPNATNLSAHFHQWNQSESSHTFQVLTGTETLHVSVEDFNSYSHNQAIVGKISIPLKTLNDQNSVTQEYQLYSNNGTLTGGSIVLQLHYVFSKVRFLESIISLKNEEIASIERDLSEFERDVQVLYTPFKHMQRFYYISHTTAARSGLIQQNGSSLIAYPELNLGMQSNNGRRIIYEDATIKAIPLGQNQYENLELYTRILTTVYIAIVMMLFIERSPFFDLMVIFYYIHAFQSNLLDDVGCIHITIALVSSLVLDILWLIFFSQHWLNSTNSVYDTMSDAGMKKASVVISFVAVVIKVLLIMCFWAQIQMMKNSQPSRQNRDLLIEMQKASPSRNQNSFLKAEDFLGNNNGNNHQQNYYRPQAENFNNDQSHNNSYLPYYSPQI